MDNVVVFEEKQRFRQWWLWLLIIGSNVLLLWMTAAQIFLGKPPASNATGPALLIIVALSLFLSAFVLGIRLRTRITQDGVSVRLFPFHASFKFYPWEKIESVQVMKYFPFKEFGGWGIRGFGKKKAYSISGDQGLRLNFTDGKMLLIGTRKPAELAETLAALGKLEK